MANNNGQRVAAFLLAFMFLLTTVGAAVFVIIELQADDSGIVEPSVQQQDLSQNEQPQEQPDVQDQGTIANFDGPVEVSELRFDDVVVGDGAEVQPGDTVTIQYTGALASDGSIFDSSVSRGEPATFPLDNLIQGWQEGIPGMKEGGKRRLYIPADKGYGEAGSPPSIPANADLIFDIELIKTER